MILELRTECVLSERVMQSPREALSRGDLPAAGAAAQALIQSRPQDAEGYFVLAMVAAEAGQMGQALPMLDKALALDPDNTEYLAQQARLLILLRRDGQAAEVARRVLEKGSDDPRTLDTVGCVLARLGDHETSVAPFEQAVAREPANLDYRYNLAAACGFTGRVDAAREQFSIGRRSMVDLLDAQRDYVRAEDTLIRAEQERFLTDYAALALTGDILDLFDIILPEVTQ